MYKLVFLLEENDSPLINFLALPEDWKMSMHCTLDNNVFLLLVALANFLYSLQMIATESNRAVTQNLREETKADE